MGKAALQRVEIPRHSESKFLDARRIRPSPVSKFHTWYGHTVNGGQKIGEPFDLGCI